MIRKKNKNAAYLTRPKTLRRQASYIKRDISSEDVNKLSDAYDNNDHDAMAKIIKKNSTEAFLGRLVFIQGYDQFTEELSREIVMNHKSKLNPEKKASASDGNYAPAIPYSRADTNASMKSISQKSKGGNVYSRKNPVNYKRSEMTFLKNNSDLSNKDLVRMYNQYFPKRSYSAITTKRYRIRK